MQLEHAILSTRSGPRRALVVAPDREEALDLDMLAQRGPEVMVDFHESIIETIRRDHAPVNAVVLRAEPNGPLTPSSTARPPDEEQLEEAGYQLVRSQLETWRCLLPQPVLLVARVELRVSELAALRMGTARLMAELEAQALGDDLERAESARVDRWLVGHALLNFGVGAETACRELLPRRIEQLEAEQLATARDSVASFPG